MSFCVLNTLRGLYPDDIKLLQDIDPNNILVPFILNISNEYLYVRESKLESYASRIIDIIGTYIVIGTCSEADIQKNITGIRANSKLNVGDKVYYTHKYAKLPFTVLESNLTISKIRAELRGAVIDDTVNNEYLELIPSNEYMEYDINTHSLRNFDLLVDMSSIIYKPKVNLHEYLHLIINFFLRLKLTYSDYNLVISNPDKYAEYVTKCCGIRYLSGCPLTYYHDNRFCDLVYTTSNVFKRYVDNIIYIDNGGGITELKGDSEPINFRHSYNLTYNEINKDSFIELCLSAGTQYMISSYTNYLRLLN